MKLNMSIKGQKGNDFFKEKKENRVSRQEKMKRETITLKIKLPSRYMWDEQTTINQMWKRNRILLMELIL